MSKLLMIFLVFSGPVLFGQSVQIDKFRLGVGESLEEMNFPIIRSMDREVEALINNDLKNRFTNFEFPNENLESSLSKWADDQIVFLDFDITYNQNGILSFHINAERCGAYCTSWTDYLNYSTTNGKWLNISDVIINLSEFKAKVKKDRKEQFTKQKLLLKEMLHDPDLGLDVPAYEWALQYYEECEKKGDLESFAIYPDHLEIIEDCYLPNAIKSLKPVIELKYDFLEIKEFLKFKL